MKQYDLINPSDPYTFIAENLEVAALTVFAISSAYGAQSEDDEETVPVFMAGIFGDPNEWFEKSFGETMAEGTKKYRMQIADALESVMYGSFNDRERYQAALDAIDNPEKREEFIKKWQESISSMNDIGSYAHSLSKRLKKDEVKKND